MKYFFCLINKEDKINGVNLGRTFAYEHRSDWVEGDGEEISKYLSSGYVKGVDHVVYRNKAYMVIKSYTDIEGKFVVFICTESVSGCDV